MPDPEIIAALNGQLDRYQGVIARLATNQVQVKTWCVTALAALAALAVNNGERGILGIGVAVLATFFVLDAYYLSLERHFRNSARAIVDQMLDQHPDLRSAFKMNGPGRGVTQVWQAVKTCGGSLAVSPFYLGLLALLVVGLALT